MFVRCAIFLSTALLLFDASAHAGEPRAVAHEHADLRMRVALEDYSRTLRSSSAEQAPRDLLMDFDRLVEGTGIVLTYEDGDSTGCGQTGGYQVSDCGTDTYIVLAFESGLRNGQRIRIGVDANVLAFAYEGNRFGPGRTGCMGFAKSGEARVISRTHESIVVSLDLDFGLVNQSSFRKGTICEDLLQHATVAFAIKAP